MITGTTKTLGVDVEDYSTKANGDYSDTITFTAEVQEALLSLNIDDKVFYYMYGETWEEAITNHSTENGDWSVINGKIVYSESKYVCYYDTTSQSDVDARNDSNIDSSKSWTLRDA